MEKKFRKFKQGALVEPVKPVACNVTPKMEFDIGMMGVVAGFDADMGALVEFYHPLSGCIETCRTFDLSQLDWPSGTTDPGGLMSTEDRDRYWNVGKLSCFGIVEYLKAVRLLNPAYLSMVGLDTLRIPDMHEVLPRTGMDDPPRVNKSFSAVEAIRREVNSIGMLKPLPVARMSLRQLRDWAGYECSRVEGEYYLYRQLSKKDWKIHACQAELTGYDRKSDEVQFLNLHEADVSDGRITVPLLAALRSAGDISPYQVQNTQYQPFASAA